MPASSSQAIRIENLSWKSIGALQKAGNDLLLLPLGATEQHGPHLPINTDTLIASRVCDYVSAETQTPVLPAICYTVSEGHTTKWPGTFSLQHATFIQVLNDLVDWAVDSSWKRLLLVNAHFGNDAPMRVAVDQLRLRHLGKLQITALNTFFLSPEIQSLFTEDALDLHANKAETDLMLYLAPETVNMDMVEDDPDRTTDHVFSYPVAQTSLNGVTGSPSLGNAADGEKLFQMIGNHLVQLVNRAKSESPPLERLHWETLRPR